MCGQGHHGMLSSLDNNLQGSALSLHHVGLRDQTLSLVLGASSIFPRHPTSPPKVSHWLPSVYICLCVQAHPFCKDSHCSRAPSPHCDQHLAKTTYREELLMTSEGSVHRHLALYFWARCEKKHHGTRACGRGNCSLHDRQKIER